MENLGIVLAAGRGKRLRPRTDSVPKPLLSHLGKTFLDYTFEALDAASVTEVIVVIGHLGEQIKKNCDRWAYRFTFTFISQNDLLGSADALTQALENSTVQWRSFNRLVVLASDYVLPRFAVKDLISEFDKEHADGAVLVTSGELDAALKGSVVTWDGSSILRIIEKPSSLEKKTQFDTAKLIYVFKTEFRSVLATKSKQSMSREESVPDRVNCLINQGARFIGLRYGQFLDADSIVV